MKLLLLIFFFFIIQHLDGNCQNIRTLAKINPDSKFTAIVDDENWEGESSLSFISEDIQYLYFIPYYKDDHIAVKINFNGIGEYLLLDSAATLVKTIGGDVIRGIYYSSGNPDDKIIISNYNEHDGFVDGYCHFTFNRGASVINVNSKYFRAYFINKK